MRALCEVQANSEELTLAGCPLFSYNPGRKEANMPEGTSRKVAASKGAKARKRAFKSIKAQVRAAKAPGGTKRQKGKKSKA